MNCAWNELLNILPHWMRPIVDNAGRDTLQELRLRMGSPPELVLANKCLNFDRMVSGEDLNFVVNTASRYSPWASQTIAQGYLTCAGGHRIGLCGQAICNDGRITGIRQVTSLCIRIARHFPGLAAGLEGDRGNVLILGPPGSGKTTLLRDLICLRSEKGEHIAVLDQRMELFPGECFPKGCCTDILTAAPRHQGIDILLRTMGPDCIAMDEITAREDTLALLQAANCGVSLMATAHAASWADFFRRPLGKYISKLQIFDTVVVLDRDKTWRRERSHQWNTVGSVRC